MVINHFTQVFNQWNIFKKSCTLGDGKYLGTDGVNDNKIFVVTDGKERKQIEKNTKTGKTTSTDVIQSEVLIPSQYIKQEIQSAVDRSNAATKDDTEGVFHEEGGIWGKDDKGNEYFVRAASGPVSNPLVDPHASINLNAFENSADAGKLQTLEGAVHIHPSGTKTKDGKTGSFNQEPSDP